VASQDEEKSCDCWDEEEEEDEDSDCSLSLDLVGHISHCEDGTGLQFIKV
jgi:hypothetical protein